MRNCDPCTQFSIPEVAELPASVYWKSSFNCLCDSRNLTEFYILHLEKSEVSERGKKLKVIAMQCYPPIEYSFCVIKE